MRYGLFLDWIDVSRDDPPVHVEPQLALVDPSDSTETHLALRDLAVAGARSAHDLVGALDGPPEFRDLPHGLPGGFANVQDFLRRNHRSSLVGRRSLKRLSSPLSRMGRTEVFPALGQEGLAPLARHEDVPARALLHV